MTRIQFNPSTQKVLFNPDTKKVLMVAAECDDCTDLAVDGVTPTLIEVTFAGLLACHGFNCCEDTTTRITDYGIGWNHSYILEQGRVLWNNGVPYWQPATSHPCWWSAIYTGDYGGWDEYNLADCQGGLVEHHDFCGIVPRVSLYHDGAALTVNIYLHLNSTGYSEQQIFHGYLNFGSSPAKCMPYGTPISNNNGCEGSPMPCFGDGTVVIAQWPPP